MHALKRDLVQARWSQWSLVGHGGKTWRKTTWKRKNVENWFDGRLIQVSTQRRYYVKRQ